MSNNAPRRTFLQVCISAATVIGLNLVGRSWVKSAKAESGDEKLLSSNESNQSQPKQSPLTVITKVKKGHYNALNSILQQIVSLPPEEDPITVAVTKIGTVHFARMTFLENNTRFAFITSYDGDFDTYIKDFIREMGDVLNQLLVHVEDAPPLPIQQYPDEFLQYVRDHNITPVIFFSAYPTLTVQDILLLADENNGTST